MGNTAKSERSRKREPSLACLFGTRRRTRLSHLASLAPLMVLAGCMNNWTAPSTIPVDTSARPISQVPPPSAKAAPRKIAHQQPATDPRNAQDTLRIPATLDLPQAGTRAYPVNQAKAFQPFDGPPYPVTQQASHTGMPEGVVGSISDDAEDVAPREMVPLPPIQKDPLQAMGGMFGRAPDTQALPQLPMTPQPAPNTNAGQPFAPWSNEPPAIASGPLAPIAPAAGSAPGDGPSAEIWDTPAPPAPKQPQPLSGAAPEATFAPQSAAQEPVELNAAASTAAAASAASADPQTAPSQTPAPIVGDLSTEAPQLGMSDDNRPQQFSLSDESPAEVAIASATDSEPAANTVGTETEPTAENEPAVVPDLSLPAPQTLPSLAPNQPALPTAPAELPADLPSPAPLRSPVVAAPTAEEPVAKEPAVPAAGDAGDLTAGEALVQTLELLRAEADANTVAPIDFRLLQLLEVIADPDAQWPRRSPASEQWRAIATATALELREADPERKVAELRKVLAKYEEDKPLELNNLAFCRQIDDFGVYGEFKSDGFAPGQELLLYVEVENFSHRKTLNGQTIEIVGGYEVLNSNGDVVESREFLADKQTFRRTRRDYYVPYRLFVPKSLPDGAYTLRLKLKDAVSEKSATATIALPIRAR